MSGRGGRGGQQPQGDISVLRSAIHVGSNQGVTQIINTMKAGTLEMKELLLHQCDIIYECKVCRNLFRGLPNFIAHKRVYCQELYCDNRLPFVDTAPEEEIVIVQPKPPPEADEKPEWDDYIDSEEESVKKEDQSAVIDVMQKGEFEGSSEDYKFYTKAVERQLKKDQERKNMTVVLEKVPGNRNAVFQSFEREDSDVVVVEPKEPKGRGRPRKRKRLDNGLEESEGKKTMFFKEEEEEVVVVEPKEATGHIRMNLRQRKANGGTMLEQLKDRDDCDVKSLECLKCKATYATVKTLHLHMSSLHSEKRVFYPCLFCSAVYAQIWSATRHITNVHGKSRQEVRGMIEEIRKQSFEKPVEDMGESSSVVKVEKKETSKVREAAAGSSADNANTTGQDFDLNFVMHRCRGCLKCFEKKDSHDRHARQCHLAKKVDQGLIPDRKSPARSSPSPTLSQMASNSEISEEEMAKILEIIDETTQQCLKCYRMFGTISNLHRHAIRHLGWRRFKCKFCRFLCYNRSECRRHLRVVHHKTVSKAVQIDKFIDKVEEGDRSSSGGGGGGGAAGSGQHGGGAAAAAGKSGGGRMARVEMQSISGKQQQQQQQPQRVDNTIRTRGGVYKKPGGPGGETVLVTRSGMYRKPQMVINKKDKDASDSESEASSASVSKQQEEEEEVEEDVMSADLSNKRRRKGTSPIKAVATNSNTPATARPASHILRSPQKVTPTKQPPNKPSTPQGNKSPMVNILSKSSSLPKFSISGGVTTVRLPVFTQCVQIQSSMRHSPMDIAPRPEQPQIRVLGPNFQLPGSSGSAEVRTIAVSSLPTGSTYTITGTTAQGMPILRPVQPISVTRIQNTTPPVLRPASLEGMCTTTAMPRLAPFVGNIPFTSSALTVMPTPASSAPVLASGAPVLGMNAPVLISVSSPVLVSASTPGTYTMASMSALQSTPAFTSVTSAPVLISTNAPILNIPSSSVRPTEIVSTPALSTSTPTLSTSAPALSMSTPSLSTSTPALSTSAPALSSSTHALTSETPSPDSTCNLTVNPSPRMKKRSSTPQPRKLAPQLDLKPRSSTPGPRLQDIKQEDAARQIRSLATQLVKVGQQQPRQPFDNVFLHMSGDAATHLDFAPVSKQDIQSVVNLAGDDVSSSSQSQASSEINDNIESASGEVVTEDVTVELPENNVVSESVDLVTADKVPENEVLIADEVPENEVLIADEVPESEVLIADEVPQSAGTVLAEHSSNSEIVEGAASSEDAYVTVIQEPSTVTEKEDQQHEEADPMQYINQ